MRRCLHCGSVSADDESTCGVCGASLEKAASVSLHEISGAPTGRVSLKSPQRRVALVFLAVFLGLAASIVLASQSVPLLAVVLVISLLFAILIGMDTFNDEGLRPFLSRGRRAFSRHSWDAVADGGADAMNREAEREEQQQRDIESGAAD